MYVFRYMDTTTACLWPAQVSDDLPDTAHGRCDSAHCENFAKLRIQRRKQDPQGNIKISYFTCTIPLEDVAFNRTLIDIDATKDTGILLLMPSALYNIALPTSLPRSAPIIKWQELMHDRYSYIIHLL